MALIKTDIEVDEHDVVKNGRRWDIDVDMCNYWRDVETWTSALGIFEGEPKSDSPLRLEESEIPSNAGTNDGYGELDGSPLMIRGRESPVWINLLRKL